MNPILLLFSDNEDTGCEWWQWHHSAWGDKLNPYLIPTTQIIAMQKLARGIRAAQAGLLVNILLVLVKLISGIVGHSYALIADAIESSTDIFSSLIVWGGLHVAARPADEIASLRPWQGGIARSAVVAVMLLGRHRHRGRAAREIITPITCRCRLRSSWWRGWSSSRRYCFARSSRVGDEIGSTAVKTDAWHHRSDAITSPAAFIGIAIALWGGPGWESADDWAATGGSGHHRGQRYCAF